MKVGAKEATTRPGKQYRHGNGKPNAGTTCTRQFASAEGVAKWSANYRWNVLSVELKCSSGLELDHSNHISSLDTCSVPTTAQKKQKKRKEKKKLFFQLLLTSAHDQVTV